MKDTEINADRRIKLQKKQRLVRNIWRKRKKDDGEKSKRTWN